MPQFLHQEEETRTAAGLFYFVADRNTPRADALGAPCGVYSRLLLPQGVVPWDILRSAAAPPFFSHNQIGKHFLKEKRGGNQNVALGLVGKG